MQPGQVVTDKSGPLTYTDSYVFNKADILGKGATATVYLGRHKAHGYVVAIKQFDQRQIRQILTAKKREIELLRNIKHKNVMRLLACEPEMVGGQEVLVMEFCQGGSVFTLLEKPENMFGFAEKMFLKFIKDICCGLKHLRSLNIIHRDIKPGNIMLKIDDDGSSVFVLTDFGAARELPEDETFMSIYGTEEYIHPAMYQRAVLHQPGQSSFDSNVDLWSLGVTIFHCACGRLPFKPFGGRQDARTMFEITSGRRSGVISGVQKQANGQIEWSNTLPETCHLSSSLRKLIEPVLAGLFEPEPARLISYDNLFKTVEEIVSMETINVFVVQAGTQVPIFIPKHKRYVNLQEAIAQSTDIPSHRQLILVSNRLLSNVIDTSGQQIQEYPKTVLQSQLYLFDRDDSDYVRYKSPAIPEFPALAFGSSLANDATIGKRCTGIAHFIETKVKETLHCQSLIRQALFNLWHHIKEVLRPTETCVPILEQVLIQSSARLQSLQLSQTNLQAISSVIAAIDSSDSKQQKDPNDWLIHESSIDDVIQRAKMRVSEIQVYITVLIQKMREQDILYSVSCRGCEEEEQCLSKFQHLHENISSVHTTFVKHKKYHDLHTHEVFIHQAESRKLEEHCVKILSLYQGHCLQNLSKMHRSAVDYTSKLLKHLTRSDKVEANVKCVLECQSQVNEKLDKVDECYRKLTQSASAKIQEILANHAKGLVDLTKSNNSVTTSGETDHLRQGAAEGTNGKGGVKKDFIRRLLSEVDNLQNESGDLDRCLQDNLDSLVELRRLLQDSGLNTSSLGNDERTEIDCV